MLSISPINLTKITNNFAKANQPIKQGLTQDVFVKSANVSFKGNEVEPKNDFMKWAEETDFLNTQLESIVTNPELKIGEGFSNTAFKIPGNDDYIIRVGTSALKFMHVPNISIATLKGVEDNLDINVGQKVASISVPSQFHIPNEPDWLSTEIEILRKQEGESIGVQPPETLVEGEYNTRTRAGVEPYEAMSRKEKYARTIHNVAELPVESYEKLLENFKKAADAGYSFDYLNSNNLLVDTEKESVNLIDMEKGKEPVEPNYMNLLYSLTNAQYYGTYTSQYAEFPIDEEKKMQAAEDTKKIIGKFMEAMQNQGEKFDRNSVSYEAHLHLLLSFPMMSFLKAGSPEAFWYKADQMGILEK